MSAKPSYGNGSTSTWALEPQRCEIHGSALEVVCEECRPPEDVDADTQLKLLHLLPGAEKGMSLAVLVDAAVHHVQALTAELVERRLDADALARLARAVDRPNMRNLVSIADAVASIRAQYSAMCDRLQACTQRHGLGLGGEQVDEQVDELVVAEVDRLRRTLRDIASVSVEGERAAAGGAPLPVAHEPYLPRRYKPKRCAFMKVNEGQLGRTPCGVEFTPTGPKGKHCPACQALAGWKPKAAKDPTTSRYGAVGTGTCARVLAVMRAATAPATTVTVVAALRDVPASAVNAMLLDLTKKGVLERVKHGHYQMAPPKPDAPAEVAA